jgi:hypothetical protein
MIPDVLKQFDLPQVAAALGGARLALLDPVDAMKVRVDTETAAKAYGRSTQIAARIQDTPLAEQYLKLLG